MSLVSGVAAPSLHLGRPRSTPTCSRSVDDTGLVAREVAELESALAARVRVLTCHSAHFTLLRVVCHCWSTRSVRALWCSRRALGVPCAVSFVSGVAAPSLHRGRPRSTPSLRGDSLRPPALATTCSSRLEFPSAVALPLGEGTYGSQPQACVRCLRAARPCRCFKRPAERIQADKNGWAGSHLTNLFQERMGWFPPYVSCFRLGWAGSHRTRPGGIFSPLAPLLRSIPPLI